MTHDYESHGTTTLFAAMSTLDGSVISRYAQRHRHVGWLDFLRQNDCETPKPKYLHLVRYNYATHKHPKVREWLAKHLRCHVHFTPTSASSLNMVGRYFRSISTDRLGRVVFRSGLELTAATEEYIIVHNQNPKSFVWTAKANDIFQKVFAPITALATRRTKHYSSPSIQQYFVS